MLKLAVSFYGPSTLSLRISNQTEYHGYWYQSIYSAINLSGLVRVSMFVSNTILF